ncbi:MAG TPA: bifunctional aldolase/short-chain dehydrogenase [Solirubrobacteraceae bacterium]|nr:bifunctional aldolase/short-chain dehydrogenase [Solirubrobacteraceae bacterium]
MHSPGSLTRGGWSEPRAARFPGPLGPLVYGSRLLGADPALVLHGGGNTSVKLREPDVFGEEQELLYVKRSGQDLAEIDASCFTALRLAQLRALAAREGLDDTVVARELRCAACDPDAPAPSVEALLHAVIPHRYVDHTHAQAVLALTNTPSGARHVREAYGDSVIVVPYTRPGYGLARVCARLISEQLTADTLGLVLMHHGLVTFGESAREAYERTLELVARAAAYADARGRGLEPSNGSAREHQQEPIGMRLAQLRADISAAAGIPLVLRRDEDPIGREFAGRADLEALSQSGPATPDHVLFTKRLPMVGTDVDAYARAYRGYFQGHATAAGAESGMQMLDPAPRVALDPELGLCTAGRTVTEARIAADLYRQTIELILRAEALEAYQALPAEDVFQVEYWPAEQAKLRRERRAEFEGEVVLITGAASGIGAACAREYLARGACVLGLDVADSVLGASDADSYLGVVCDITDGEQVAAAVERCTLAFGGIDMLVLSAGVFPPSQRIEDLRLSDWQRTLAVNADANLMLLRLAHPYLALAPAGGRVVVIASKNVPAPGPGAAAYSASKAALTQLARVAALEWGGDGVRVNVLHPNAVFDTGIWTEDVISARAASYGLTPQQYRTSNVLGVEVTSDDVARLACALCGDAFAKTTGAQIPVDGGNERVI